MVGVHSMGSAPEQAELEGWSSELKVKPALGVARSGRAPCPAEAALTRRMNDLTWWLCRRRLRAAQEGRNDRGCWCSAMGVEEAAGLFPGGHGGCRQVEQPCVRSAGEGHGEPVGHDPIVTSSFEEGLLAHQQKGQRIYRAAVARRHRWLELVRPPYPL